VVSRQRDQQVIEDARESLPYEIRGLPWNPTPWDVQARTMAAKALQEMRPDADGAEMRAVAREAVKTVIAAYEAQKAAEADRKMRQSVLRSTRLPDGLSDHSNELALKATAEAVDALPQGTPRNKLEKPALARSRRSTPPLRRPRRGARPAGSRSTPAAGSRQSGKRTRVRLMAISHTTCRVRPDQGDRSRAPSNRSIPTGTAKHELEAARDRAVQTAPGRARSPQARRPADRGRPAGDPTLRSPVGIRLGV